MKLLYLLLLFFLVSCVAPIELSYNTIAKGSYSGVEEAKNVVIRDDTSYIDLWNEMYSLRSPIPERPSVDFKHSQVVGVFQGVKNTGGYSIEVDHIVDDGNVVVYYSEKEPLSGAIVTQAVSSPYHLVMIDTTRDVEFVVSPRISG